MDNADGVAGVIDEHFLAGPVILPQYHIQMARPISILITKPTVVDAIGLVLLVFLPQQLQRDTAVGLQLLVYLEEVRRWSPPCRRLALEETATSPMHKTGF